MLYVLLDRTVTVMAVCREVEEKVGRVYFARFMSSLVSFTPIAKSTKPLNTHRGQKEEGKKRVSD